VAVVVSDNGHWASWNMEWDDETKEWYCNCAMCKKERKRKHQEEYGE
jgi:hypothetical protein